VFLQTPLLSSLSRKGENFSLSLLIGGENVQKISGNSMEVCVEQSVAPVVSYRLFRFLFTAIQHFVRREIGNKNLGVPIYKYLDAYSPKALYKYVLALINI